MTIILFYLSILFYFIPHLVYYVVTQDVKSDYICKV